MGQLPRLSHHRLRVLRIFLDQPGVELAGADIMRQTSLSSGSLYPILYCFEEWQFLESRWEAERPEELRRPRRRLYRMTALGESTAREALTGRAVTLASPAAAGKP